MMLADLLLLDRENLITLLQSSNLQYVSFAIDRREPQAVHMRFHEYTVPPLPLYISNYLTPDPTD
jgi:hypothetical protein